MLAGMDGKRRQRPDGLNLAKRKRLYFDSKDVRNADRYKLSRRFTGESRAAQDAQKKGNTFPVVMAYSR